MGSNLIRYLCILMALFSTLQLGEGPKSAAQAVDQDVQVIPMTAKTCEFSPSPVHVKAGMTQLKITAIDQDGFKISVVPEGADALIHPGLEFDRHKETKVGSSRRVKKLRSNSSRKLPGRTSSDVRWPAAFTTGA
jgi:hypothetical protein